MSKRRPTNARSSSEAIRRDIFKTPEEEAAHKKRMLAMMPEILERTRHLASPSDFCHDFDPDPNLLGPEALSAKAEPAKPTQRLTFDPETLCITLDGEEYKIADPKTFAIYHFVAKNVGQAVTRADVSKEVRGARNPKAVADARKALPPALADTLKSGPPGIWVELPRLEKTKALL